MYIFWFLHQTTTHSDDYQNSNELYIFWFLHQTTTCGSRKSKILRCISFDSYIKPQHLQHNILLQECCISFDSYIKPQLPLNILVTLAGCISFDSYIKPQPKKEVRELKKVVYLLIPTSNHNYLGDYVLVSCVVYLLIPTSNHNFLYNSILSFRLYIFWFLHQTTTCTSWALLRKMLYIFWFLHQTTTFPRSESPKPSCISFDSYIKPQRNQLLNVSDIVVYLLIPTSNHNYRCVVYYLD